MLEKSPENSFHGVSNSRAAQDAPGLRGRITSALTRTCRGHNIEPELAKGRDDLGEIFLATVWHCSTLCKNHFLNGGRSGDIPGKILHFGRVKSFCARFFPASSRWRFLPSRKCAEGSRAPKIIASCRIQFVL